MREIQIEKKDLQKQLWPISLDGVLVFETSFLGEEGFFGIRDNNLIFIDIKNIEKEFVLQIPENLDEVQGFLSSADYILNRFMMTPTVYVEGFDQEKFTDEVVAKEVLSIFSEFIDRFSKNSHELEGIRNKW